MTLATPRARDPAMPRTSSTWAFYLSPSMEAENQTEVINRNHMHYCCDTNEVNGNVTDLISSVALQSQFLYYQKLAQEKGLATGTAASPDVQGAGDCPQSLLDVGEPKDTCTRPVSARLQYHWRPFLRLRLPDRSGQLHPTNANAEQQ